MGALHGSVADDMWCYLYYRKHFPHFVGAQLPLTATFELLLKVQELVRSRSLSPEVAELFASRTRGRFPACQKTLASCVFC